MPCSRRHAVQQALFGRTWNRAHGKVESLFTARVCSWSLGSEDMRASKLTATVAAPSNATLADAPDQVNS